MIDTWIASIGGLIGQNLWLAPILALAAGALTSLLPCSLSSVPLIVAYVGGAGNDTKKAFRLSLLYAAGSALTFTVLGTIAALAGNLIGTSQHWWYIVLGVLMVLMALQTWEIINLIPSTFLVDKSSTKGYIGAFLAGILGGIFSSPCATPVLIALLAIVAGKGSLLFGIVLMLMYGIGHGALAVAAGTSVGFVKGFTGGKKSKALKIILGVLIMLIGLYMFYLGF